MTTHREAQRAELPPSYKGSTLSSKLYGGASVNFHFDSVEEAEAWHMRVNVESAKAAVPLTTELDPAWLSYTWCQEEREDDSWAEFTYVRFARAVVAKFCEVNGITTAPHPKTSKQEAKGKFKLGDEVRKTKGSQWHGTVVGTYSTTLTPEGYAVESMTEKGSVQIYPVTALELCRQEAQGGQVLDEEDPMWQELEAFRKRHWQHWNAAENLLIAHLVARMQTATPKPQAEPAPSAAAKGWPNVESAMEDPLFQRARAIMGTENWFQDNALRNVINYVLAAHPTPDAPQADALDAARWRYSVAIGENQTMNWRDVYDDWDGDGDFTNAIDAAMSTKEPKP